MLDNPPTTNTANVSGSNPTAEPRSYAEIAALVGAFDELSRTPISTEAAVVKVVSTYWHQVDDWEGSLWSFFAHAPVWDEVLVSHAPLQLTGDHRDLFLHMLDNYAELTDDFAEQGGCDIAYSADNQIWWRSRATGALMVDVILNVSTPHDLRAHQYTLAATWQAAPFTVRLVAPALWCLRATWGPDGWKLDDNRPDPDTQWDESDICAAEWKYPWR